MKGDKLKYQLYLQRENQFYHQSYVDELGFYAAVAQGNLKFIKDCKEQYTAEDGVKGSLSDNPVRNERYHLIINAAIITRICIENGLSQEEGYTLSDLYIRQADKTNTVEELRKLNDEMVWEFASEMHELHTREVVSIHVSHCIDYIYDHLHCKLTVDLLGREIGLHPSYLSALFKQETGSSIHAFILAKRLQTAENMLRNTRYSYAEIAQTLCFSSQSHFIRLFREKNGVTPGEYRKRYAV